MRKVRYWQEKFSLARPLLMPGRPLFISAEDATRIAGVEFPPRDGSGSEFAFLVVHGLLSNHRGFGILELAESLTRFGPVFSIDLRGHGFSSGECTLGSLEALDVAAATSEIRRRTPLRLVTIGFSMGAAACVRAAALYEPPDAVVAASSPARWHGRRRWAARRTRLIWRTPGGKTILRLLTGVRLAPRWTESEEPATCAGKIAPAALLVVHGTDDNFFPLEEARDLLDSGVDPKELWVIEGGGHAEGLFCDPGKRIEAEKVDWFAAELVSRTRSLLRR